MKQSLAKPRRWRSGRVLFVAGIVAALSAGVLSPAPAGAATSSSLLYSTDGGATWSATATVAAGDDVLVRQWFDNTGTASETGASVRTTVPAGFTLQGGSTQVCLNPSTTNPSSPSSAELVCEDSNESSVWSGTDLQISPSAGFYGESTGSTSGLTAFGRKRYLNLHQCIWDDGNQRESLFSTAATGPDFDAVTNVSNTADGSPACGIGNVSWIPNAAQSGVKALDLLGNQWLNLHQCVYTANTTDLRTYLVDTAAPENAAGSNTSNTADAAPTCGSGSVSEPPATGYTASKALEIASNRYVHLNQCVWVPSFGRRPRTSTLIDTFSAPDYRAASSSSGASTEPLVCGSSQAPYVTNGSHDGVQSLDLLDTARGAGYVEYALTAPASPSPVACAGSFGGTEAFTQDGTYQSDQTSTATSSGDLTVDFSALTDPCPTDPIPAADPVIGGAILAVAGAGYLLYRSNRAQLA